MASELAVKLREAVEGLGADAPPAHLDRAAMALAFQTTLALAAQPANTRRGTEAALRTLERFDETVMRLAEDLDSLGPDERLALGGGLGRAWTALRVIKASVEAGHAKLTADAPWPKRVSKPRNVAAETIAMACARAFRDLVGRRATVPAKDGKAYGPFLGFVTAAFLAAGLDAKPEGYARRAAAAERKESSPPK